MWLANCWITSNFFEQCWTSTVYLIVLWRETGTLRHIIDLKNLSKGLSQGHNPNPNPNSVKKSMRTLPHNLPMLRRFCLASHKRLLNPKTRRSWEAWSHRHVRPAWINRGMWCGTLSSFNSVCKLKRMRRGRAYILRLPFLALLYLGPQYQRHRYNTPGA